MAQTIRCPACAATYLTKESLEGQRLKCPACQTGFEVPAQARPTNSEAGGEELEEYVPGTRPCPLCGRGVSEEARYCPNCNEIISSGLRPWLQFRDHRLNVLEIGLALVFPCGGFLLGVVWAVQKKRKATDLMFISFFFGVLVAVVTLLFRGVRNL